MRLALALTLLGSGAVAQDCPTVDDLETGIRLTRQEPFFSIIVVKEDDRLAEYTILSPGGAPSEHGSQYDTHLVPVSRLGGQWRYEYAQTPPTIEDLGATRNWASEFNVLDRSGNLRTTGALELAVTGLGDVEIGECSYTVWRIDETHLSPGRDPARFQKAFSPDLGLVLSSIALDAVVPRTASVFFDEIAAE